MVFKMYSCKRPYFCQTANQLGLPLLAAHSANDEMYNLTNAVSKENPDLQIAPLIKLFY